MMPCAKYMHSGDSHPPSTPNDTRLVALHLTQRALHIIHMCQYPFTNEIEVAPNIWCFTLT